MMLRQLLLKRQWLAGLTMVRAQMLLPLPRLAAM